MNKFNCFKCQKKSRYVDRVGGLKWELGGQPKRDGKRTYKCERCGAHNEITNSGLEWMQIDIESRSS
jgi:hypothetical protein